MMKNTYHIQLSSKRYSFTIIMYNNYDTKNIYKEKQSKKKILHGMGVRHRKIHRPRAHGSQSHDRCREEGC